MPRKPRDEREFRLHCVIADLLRLKAHPRLLWFHVPNGEERGWQAGSRLKRMGTLPGVFDLAFVLPNGRPAFMEIKAGDEELSLNQECFRLLCVRFGIEHAVVRSSYQAEDVLAGWGGLRQRVAVAA